MPLSEPSEIEPEPSEIEPDVLYWLTEFERRVGWKRGATRAARRKGLKVTYVSRRGYILGKDGIEWILQNGRNER